jgi:hypothetical protein
MTVKNKSNLTIFIIQFFMNYELREVSCVSPVIQFRLNCKADFVWIWRKSCVTRATHSYCLIIRSILHLPFQFLFNIYSKGFQISCPPYLISSLLFILFVWRIIFAAFFKVCLSNSESPSTCCHNKTDVVTSRRIKLLITFWKNLLPTSSGYKGDS